LSASRERKTRKNAGLDQNETKQREERAARRNRVIYIIIGVAAALLAIFTVVWNSGLIQRTVAAVTVGDRSYSAAHLQYYYQTAYNYEKAMASYGLSGFNSSISAKSQTYNEAEGTTYYDYFMKQALEELKWYSAMAQSAKKDGYVLDQEGQEAVNSAMSSLKTQALTSGYGSVPALLKGNYGAYVTEGVYKQLLEERVTASSYAQGHSDSLEYSDEELEAYYQENKDNLDHFALSYFVFRASTQTSTTDEAGNTVELTEEQQQALFEADKAEMQQKAEEVLAALEGGADFRALEEEYEPYGAYENETRIGSSVTEDFADWAKEAGRQAGDLTLTEYDGGTSYVYYVARFEDRVRDEDPTSYVRHILVAAEQDSDAAQPTEEQYAAAREKAEQLLAGWEAGEATEESFGALAVEHSADTSSASNGGLMSSPVTKYSGYVDPFTDWALAPARQPGDTGIVQNTGSSTKGWHIMYFVNWEDPSWKYTARNTLRSEAYTEWSNAIVEAATLTEKSGMGYVK